MRRVLNVMRLQMINRQTFIWVPLIVLGSATLLSVLIYAMIPLDAAKYGGGGQAPLWYFFAIGISAMSLTFPFSQAMSITRREFFLGTMLTAALASAFMAVLFLIGGGIEIVTNGWGVNGYLFYLPGFWDAGWFGAWLAYFTLALFFFVLGFTGATIYKSWGLMALTISWVTLALVLIGVIFLITRLEIWMQVWETFGLLGPLGLATWGLVLTAVCMGLSFIAFRRTVP